MGGVPPGAGPPAAARTLVQKAGGTVRRDLGVIGGFSATVPATVATALRALPGVTVTADATVRMKSLGWSGQTGTTLLNSLINSSGGKNADKDDPDDGDARTGQNLTGAGIGIAVIDSGVAPVSGLNGSGKVVNGPDLSFESQAPNLRNLDTFGHGTHMAGIISGQDPSSVPAGQRFDGVAPDAKIINMKVAAADGAADVSQVIAAIDWVVAHKDDKGLNIRVMNLSFGTQSTQSATLDPLSFAVEQAWKEGIVVVVSAGNDGLGDTLLTMPAVNPDIIAVGAVNTNNTDTRTDDTVADFTNRGNSGRHADVLAPGSSMMSLRVPGSFIDRSYPSAVPPVTVDPAQRFFRGSGTSQAAAVVSGTVALLLQQRPKLAPNQVKALLMSTADAVKGDVTGSAGQINIGKAARAKTPGGSPQINLAATGLGSLEKSRGGAYVYDSANNATLTGEKDIFGKSWNAASWALNSKLGKSWSGGTFNGTTWAGSSFGSSVNNMQTWGSTTWTGRTWAGATWSGRTWATTYWTGRSWASTDWAGRSWAGRSWASKEWMGDPWQ